MASPTYKVRARGTEGGREEEGEGERMQAEDGGKQAGAGGMGSTNTTKGDV